MRVVEEQEGKTESSKTLEAWGGIAREAAKTRHFSRCKSVDIYYLMVGSAFKGSSSSPAGLLQKEMLALNGLRWKKSFEIFEKLNKYKCNCSVLAGTKKNNFPQAQDYHMKNTNSLTDRRLLSGDQRGWTGRAGQHSKSGYCQLVWRTEQPHPK